MKLGLIIKSTNNGEQEVFAINKQEEWARFTMDTRSIIKDLNGFDGSGKYVIIAKILGKLGYLLAVVKARPEGSGRPNDNTTAWIHVPAHIKITGEKLCSVITGVQQQLSAPMGINQDSLMKLFSTDYQEKNVLFTALAFSGYNQNGNVGWRQYGQGTGYELYELLGDSIAQADYKKYKCICFTDTSLKLSMVEGEAITQDIKPINRIEAPDNQYGFRLFIIGNANSYIPFDKDIEFPANAKVRFAWRREGYSDIIKNNPNDLGIQESEIKVLLQRSWIKVQDSRFKTLTDAEIFVNNTPFTNSVMEVPQTDLQDGSIKIQVAHDGYGTKEVSRQISHDIVIRLDDKHYSQEYILRPEDGNGLRSDAQITVKTNNYEIPCSPFKGYYCTEDYHIVYEDNIMLKIKWFAIGAATILALWLLWVGYKAVDNWADNHTIKWGLPPKIEEVNKPATVQQSHKVPTPQQEVADTVQDLQKEQVCNYLEANKIWHRDSLRQYNLTKNLFDNMNSFNLPELSKLKESELKDIERIQQLVEAADQALSNNIDPKIGRENHNGKYNAAADFYINIANYISWIKERHKPTSQKNATAAKASKSNASSNEDDKMNHDTL